MRILEEIEKNLGHIYDDVSQNNKFEYGAIDDHLLHDCLSISYAVLEDPENEDKIDDNDLLTLYEFILLKSEYLNTIKLSLNIEETNSFAFAELKMTTDMLEDLELVDDANAVVYSVLAKDINFIQVQLNFCYAVFRNIVRNRNLFVD